MHVHVFMQLLMHFITGKDYLSHPNKVENVWKTGWEDVREYMTLLGEVRYCELNFPWVKAQVWRRTMMLLLSYENAIIYPAEKLNTSTLHTWDRTSPPLSLSPSMHFWTLISWCPGEFYTQESLNFNGSLDKWFNSLEPITERDG